MKSVTIVVLANAYCTGFTASILQDIVLLNDGQFLTVKCLQLLSALAIV